MNKRKVITILSTVLLLVALPVSVFLVGKQQNLFLKASPEEVPKEIKIANISDNSFSVSWITGKSVIGFLVYGKSEGLGFTASDDRDTASKVSRTTHHITVKNLEPGTRYFFKMGSGGSAYDNSGTSYVVTTAPTTNDPPPLADPAYGKVLGATGGSLADALVYLTLEGGTPLSTYTREAGNWLITLNNARTADLSRFIKYSGTGVRMSIYVQAADKGIAQASADTQNDSPVPNIKIGQNLAFAAVGVTPTVLPTPTGSLKASEFSLQEVEPATKSAVALEVLAPNKDEKLPSTRPTFSGTGKPGEVITITIHSAQVITAQVTAGSDGQWSYTPNQDLSPGQHSVTIAQGGSSDSQQFVVLGAKTTTASASSLPVSGAVSNLLYFVLVGVFLLVGGIVFALI